MRVTAKAAPAHELEHDAVDRVTILYKKEPSFYQISYESARIRTFMRNGRLSGKPTGFMRVEVDELVFLIQ